MKKNTIEFTYTRKHTAELNEIAQDVIAQTIYAAFINELSDYIDDGEAENIPGNTLKDVFYYIVGSMMEDKEFWED